MKPSCTTIAGAAVCLPTNRESARSAGISENATATADAEGYGHIPLAPPGEQRRPVEDLAVPAATAALKQAGRQAADLDLVIYACMYDQGHNVPMPHARLARLLGADRAVALCVQQMSGGGATALEIAASLLRTQPHYTTALVATGDIFDDTPHTRWVERAPRGILFGDGATAAVLHTHPEPPTTLTLAAIASSGRPATELQFFTSFAPTKPPADTDGRRLHLQAIPVMRAGVSEAVALALEQADLAPDDPRIQLVAFSRLGKTLLRRVYYLALPEGLPAPVSFTSLTAHLGSGDMLANLAHINDEGMLSPGGYALLINIAMGFTATAALIHAPR